MTCLPNTPIPTAGDVDELRSFLKALNKEKFVEQLVTNGIASVDSLASASLETLTLNKTLPKMVARSVLSVLEKTSELYSVLKSKKKTQFYGALVASKVYTLEDFCNATGDELPLPKMTARVLRKKADEAMKLRPLRDFLKSINKERCFDPLVALNIQKPEDIRDSSIEVLSKAGGKMLARVLLTRAREFCVPNGPDYKVKLSDETKREIRTIWKSLRGHSSPSFGQRFYELLVELDQQAVTCFAGVSFATLGRELDDMLERFVTELDSPPNFDELSDDLVARLMRYNIPCCCLWLSDEVFKLAAISVSPELEVTNNMNCWKEFHRALIPPLHPTLLKATRLPTKEDWEILQVDFAEKVNESFVRQGYLYLTLWLVDPNASHFADMEHAILNLVAWQNEKGSWTEFEQSSRSLFFNMNEQMALEFCVLTSQMVFNRYGAKIGRSIGNLLKVVACALYGVDKLSESYRAVQKDKVCDQWNDVFSFVHDEFGESFYERFTEDPMIAATFEQTANMKMQRQRFVHQFNAVMIRIGGDVEAEVRDMLLQLGARHRVYYRVGRHEMLAFMEPLVATLKEMIGRSQWRKHTIDAWNYVLTVIQNYMLAGWTCGATILEGSSENILDTKLLQEFRNTSGKEFEKFFNLFGEKMQPDTGANKASTRYLDAVNRILDEVNNPVAMDQIHALGCRHIKYHDGITVQTLVSASKQWMSLANVTFGERFMGNIALNWARMWQLIASGMSPEYTMSKLTPSLEELVGPFSTTKRKSVIGATTLTLKKKMKYPHEVCLLQFESSDAVEMRAGHFVKLRIQLPAGKKSRFYSVASSPCPINGTAKSLEFLVKEVKGGKVSPHLFHNLAIDDACELLTVAGSFVLPQPVDGTQRLMVSAGVGIVAFMSAIRSVVAHIDEGLLKRKVSLSLIHSERQPTFPFMDELLAISKRFCKNHELFSFDLTLCFTGKQPKREVAQLKSVSVKSGRVDRDLLSDRLNKFSESAEIPIYACGPRGFQKLVRETFLKEIGHKRSLIHLEFFDL